MRKTRGGEKQDYRALAGASAGRKRQAKEDQQQIRDDAALAQKLQAEEHAEEEERQRKQAMRLEKLGAKLQFPCAGPKWKMEDLEGERERAKPAFLKVAFKQAQKKKRKKAAAAGEQEDLPEGLQEFSSKGGGLYAAAKKSMHQYSRCFDDQMEAAARESQKEFEKDKARKEGKNTLKEAAERESRKEVDKERKRKNSGGVGGWGYAHD